MSVLPVDGSGWNERITVDGRESSTFPWFNRVSPGFFATMRTPLVIGRDFGSQDVKAAPVAIVTQAFVREFFPAGSPLGRTFDVLMPVGTPPVKYTVIGVVKDSKYNSLRRAFAPIAYVDGIRCRPRIPGRTSWSGRRCRCQSSRTPFRAPSQTSIR